MAEVLVVVINGSEDIETITPIDMLRRAGANVTVASCTSNKKIQLATGTHIQTDCTLNDVASRQFQMIVVPGGPGAAEISHNTTLVEMLRRQKEAGRWLAGICASPAKVFEPHGLLQGERATCYPMNANELSDRSKTNERVVTSNKLVTSMGPGTAMDFSIELVNCLFGSTKAQEVSGKVCYTA